MAYGAPLYGEPLPVRRSSRLALAALVLGVASIPLGVVLVGSVTGVIAMVLGALAGRENGFRGHALTGLVCGAIGTVIAIVTATWLLTSPRFAEFRDCYEGAQTSEQRQQCRADLADRLES